MMKLLNLIIAAFFFFMFSYGFALLQMNRWLLGLIVMACATAGIIKMYFSDGRREEVAETRQAEINNKEEFKQLNYHLKTKTSSGDLLINMEGFSAPREDFIDWSEVQGIFSSKIGGGSYAAPTPYYLLSFTVRNKHIRISFKNSNEHVKVVEEISRWLWQKKTAGLTSFATATRLP
jgi:Ca2+/Na+ antiporter